MDYQVFYQEMNTYYYRANCYHTIRDPQEDATSGNMHVLNATYHLISEKLGGYQDPVNLSRDFVKELRFVKDTMVEPGLLIRAPSKANDLESQDDYIGLMVSSMLLPPNDWAKQVNNYGDKHMYYYDNLHTSFRLTNYQARFPGLVGVYKRASGEPISVLDRVGFCADIIFDLLFPKSTNDTSGRILQWMKNRVMKGEGQMVDYCIGLWEARIKKDYAVGQMGSVLGAYHGFQHPFARAMMGKI